MPILTPSSSLATNQHHPHRCAGCFRRSYYPCDIALHGVPSLDCNDRCSGLYHVRDHCLADLGCSFWTAL